MRSPDDGPQSRFLSGNEAFALGAIDAGLSVAAAYPGTPSTEIIETLATFPGVHAEWSVNEKVALEVALGASLAGQRAVAAMKHVGLNVASDTLMSSGLTGVGAGLVIAVADDVGFSSSQNEQDSRYWSRFAHLPVLEPSDAQQAYLMAREAFALSERHQVPVLLRLTTRVCHVKRAVRLEAALPPPAPVQYTKDAARWVLSPGHIAKRLEVRAARDAALRREAEDSHWNAIETGSDRRLGVIASGPVCHAVREALPEAPLLTLGFSAPLPIELVRRFAGSVDAVLVLEETEPLVETELLAAGLAVHGRSLLPPFGEISGQHIARAARRVLGESEPPSLAAKAQEVFTRPPTLCAGCGYLGVYYWLSHMPNAIVCGDIGCYTLGASPPWNSVDTVLAMGASVGMAGGVAKAVENAAPKRPVIAVIGDSTFLHSGMQGLLNLTYQGANVTVLLLDNSATAMTGGQNNPANGRDINGGRSPVRVDLPKLVEALGVRPERIRSTDPYELPTFLKILREEMKADEPSVIISTRPCVFTPEFERDPPLVVDEAMCNGCTNCLDVGCPALLVTRREERVRPSGAVVNLAWVAIDEQHCTGCAICAKACARGAIAPKVRNRIIKLEPA
jgi:indolepyruvate ferredoxin oxidoreductase, alpha subunit